MENAQDPGPKAGGGQLLLRFPSRAASLAAAREQVREHLRSLDLEQNVIYAVDLVLEEIVGNAIRHGATDAEREIRVELALDEARVRVTVVDEGPAFDPTLHPSPPPPRSLAETPLGGRGINLVRAVASSMRYRRAQGRNHLEVDVRRTGRR